MTDHKHPEQDLMETIGIDLSTDGDIHSTVAAKMFEKAPEDVTPDERRAGRAVNFAVLYGKKRKGGEL